MEDLIYILIALLWVVFSAVKTRQKQTTNPVDEEDPPQRTTWEQMLEELLPPEPLPEEPDDKPIETAYEVPKSPTPAPEETYVSPYMAYASLDHKLESTFSEPVSLEDTDELQPLLAGRYNTSRNHDTNESTYNPALVAELRKAIVYNAILNRPTW